MDEKEILLRRKGEKVTSTQVSVMEMRMEEWRDPPRRKMKVDGKTGGKMGNEKEVETSRLILRWVRNFKKRAEGG